ncbi:MAG: Rieske 2Fe-2S domain-containing protein [Rhodobacteraceae bacterium]|nr:Rieske 2Fe-2S domain-containing protein [Paracoccaceae bacterium]
MEVKAREIVAPRGVYETLPSRVYTSPDLFSTEQERIFARSWQLAGHQSQTPNSGDFRVERVAGEDILIVRGDDGVLRAFYNICIHRGHALVEGSGCRKLFTCPYHAWGYDTRGRLRVAPNADEAGFDPTGKALKQVRLELLNGLVYVNLDTDAPGLADTLGPTAREIQEYLPNLNTCVWAHRSEEMLQANWKVVIENFNECYHCAVVHKSFTEGIVDPASYRIVDRGDSFLHCSLSQSNDRRAYAYDHDADEKSSMFASWLIWPLSAVQLYPGGVGMTFRWIPISADQTKVEVDWWLTDATPTEMEAALIENHATTTFSEDFPLVESVQRSMHSRGFDTGFILVDEQRSQMSEHVIKGIRDRYLQEMESYL